MHAAPGGRVEDESPGDLQKSPKDRQKGPKDGPAPDRPDPKSKPAKEPKKADRPGGGGGKSQPAPGHPRPATDEDMKSFRGYRRLRKETLRIIEGPNPAYNCVGNTLPGRNRVVWPGQSGSGWKPLASILEMYRSEGMNLRPSKPHETFEPGDIAVYGFAENRIMHVGLVLPNGRVDSKLKDKHRIEHSRDDLNDSNYGHFLFYLKRADAPAGPQPPRRRKGDELEAMAIRPPAATKARGAAKAMAAPPRAPPAAPVPAGTPDITIGYVIDGPDRYAFHAYFDCPALERSDLPLQEIEVPDGSDLAAAAATLGLEACQVCLAQLAREPLGEFAVQGGGFWSGGQFFLLIHPDRVELVRVASGMAQALGIGVEWRDIRIEVGRITLVRPAGGGLLSALSPPTLRIETATEGDWIGCTFAETRDRDRAVALLRQVMAAK